ncbi:hypothetical protein PN4B1_16720 [Paenibacillus naphthalenovorans]|nr:hypothetical protein PN4B1_16720 [Paenibacillus naphthalenovorans]
MDEFKPRRCPICRGKGTVGGLQDGNEWIPEEECFYCDGKGHMCRNDCELRNVECYC